MLLWIKANRERLENWLATATAALFAAAVCTNIGRFFSVRQTLSVPGQLCSWAYLIAWALSAVVLHGHPQWLRIILRTRWLAVAAILLGLAVGASDSYSLFSGACAIPYAVFISAYGGLSQSAWIYYLLPLAQALIATLLFRRLRQRKKRRRS